MFAGLPKSERGRVFDIPAYVGRLMRAGNVNAFLSICIAHSDDFLQLTGDERGVQLDFPMVNPRQRNFEKKIREVALRGRLEVVENYGSDEARFLDVNVNGEPREVAAICSKVLREVFSVSGDAELIFQHVGLAPDRAT
ncbi:MAG: hypothetical protein H0T45_18880 [Pyrinomonadaceae bacterium]|nr:hypothetical protein [Pyrinomonadaceae bacterium]